ncbi:MAG TPA: PAS domain-containing sensor histidine kinase, partial [Sulfuricurvum sp.]|nr:PAS domain-containing sensor histidine kinase [Sulfuricurvum sp.]
KELAQTYLDIAAVMVLILDTNYTIKSINRKGCEVIGYRADEAVGKNFIELFVPSRIREKLYKVANDFIDYNQYDYYENPILTKSGDERLIAWRNRQLFDEHGEFIGILSSGEDITDIRHTQEQLQESEAFYRTVFGSIEESIVILNDNCVVDCNDVALKLFDTSKELFVGQSIFDTAYEIECKDYSLHHHITVAQNGEFTSTQCTLRLHTNPNIVKIVEFSFSRFGSTEENKLVMISRDITRKVEEEKLLTMHGRQAQMGEMISMIAHQWRQPLAIINAITTHMRFKLIMKDTEDHESIDNLVKIEQQSAHLSQTISDYRDFFRPDKPKEHFNVLSLIDRALNLIDHTLKSHSIHIENDRLYDPILYTYRNEVLQVLIVLLKNAFDAFVENKVIGGEIIISAYHEEQYCVISIQDNAGGISKDVMYKLFSPYFTTKNESFGTGLGLYMSRIIIEDHCDGLIEAFSEGNTTTFSIKLPYEEEK